MRHTEADRELAARHVVEGEARIAFLRNGIAVSEARGHPIDLAERALDTMLVTLGHMRDHLVAIELDMDAPGIAEPLRP